MSEARRPPARVFVSPLSPDACLQTLTPRIAPPRGWTPLFRDKRGALAEGIVSSTGLRVRVPDTYRRVPNWITATLVEEPGVGSRLTLTNRPGTFWPRFLPVIGMLFFIGLGLWLGAPVFVCLGVLPLIAFALVTAGFLRYERAQADHLTDRLMAEIGARELPPSWRR